MLGKIKKNIFIGQEVEIVLKEDQCSGALTSGIVKRVLTNSSFHPHGIKVELETGAIGRVKELVEKK
jgi:uncharacterized repeat protein (TIGR03833 family)